jgi:hypothetical protein
MLEATNVGPVPILMGDHSGDGNEHGAVIAIFAAESMRHCVAARARHFQIEKRDLRAKYARLAKGAHAIFDQADVIPFASEKDSERLHGIPVVVRY